MPALLALVAAFGRQEGEEAPEFDSDAAWFNVSRPLKLAELRGRAVLLDFWTYG